MTYQLATAKIWNGSSWVTANDGSPIGLGSVVLNNTGASPTASSTINTKGAWLQVVASTSDIIDFLWIGVSAFASSVATGSLLDIGVGAAGSEVAIVSNIAVGSTSVRGLTNNEESVLLLPVPNIAAGSRIAVRVQSVVVSKTVAVYMTGYRINRPVTALDLYGTSTSTSRGTNLGTSYTEITASTSQEYQYLVCIVSGSTASILNVSTTVTIGYGAAGSEVSLGSFPIRTNTSEVVTSTGGTALATLMPGVPSGSRLAAKLGLSTHCDLTIIGIA
jgi:hypothetical protein